MITVRYYSVDGNGRSRARRFETIVGARAYAIKMVGAHPDFGTGYAVSSDGIGKVTVQGVTLHELFGSDRRIQ